MTLVKVMERKYQDNGKAILNIRKDKFNIPVIHTEFKTYYMDLTQEEELKLRKTGRFGFESVSSFDVPKITPQEKTDGAARKRDVLRD